MDRLENVIIGVCIALIVVIAGIGIYVVISGGAACPAGQHYVQTGSYVVMVGKTPVVMPEYGCES